MASFFLFYIWLDTWFWILLYSFSCSLFSLSLPCQSFKILQCEESALFSVLLCRFLWWNCEYHCIILLLRIWIEEFSSGHFKFFTSFKVRAFISLILSQNLVFFTSFFSFPHYSLFVYWEIGGKKSFGSCICFCGKLQVKRIWLISWIFLSL